MTFLVAVGLPMAAILTADAGDAEVTPGSGDWVLVGLVGIATGATFALLVPWSLRGVQDRRRALRSGLTLSITGFVLPFVFFWTMVPVIFGSAGAWLGYVERE